MRRIHMVCLMVAVGCLMGAGKSDLKTVAERQKILGKWEVVSAERDGKAQHGQVGREPGDVITIAENDLGKLVLG